MIEILNDFERHLIEDGKRPKTVESYVGDMKGLMEYLSEMNGSFYGRLSRFYITSYKNKLLERDYRKTNKKHTNTTKQET